MCCLGRLREAATVHGKVPGKGSGELEMQSEMQRAAPVLGQVGLLKSMKAGHMLGLTSEQQQ